MRMRRVGKARRAVPTIYPTRRRNGGHASLCPPYELPGTQSFRNTIDAIHPVISAMKAVISP